ncbi:MAG TPA: hypothetical protein DDY78_22155 [Planctomycetales bacterium]|nr:hypothetical protein [Planctomycetales bacterium]
MVWSVTPRVPLGRSAAQTSFTLGGPSHTAAARAGFQVLHEGGDYDAGCLLAVVKDGALDPEVYGLDAKIRAAVQVGIRRVVVVPNSTLDKTKIQDLLDRDPDLVVECLTLADAVHEATGLASGLRLFLDWVAGTPEVAGLPDRELPRYLGGRKLSDLYIEPEVHSNRVRLDDEEKGGAPKGREVLSADSDAAELLRRYAQFGRQRDRVRWAREWPNARRSVIVGFPGEGKTILAKMTAKALAEKGKRELTEQEKAATAVTLPVFVRLAELAERGSLEAAVEGSLPPPNAVDLPPSFVKHLRDSLRAASTWLILDGLDEIPEAKRPDVKAILETLRDAECRVVVTSRPYGYRRGELPFAFVSEYELAPLSPRQRQDFLKGWFKDGQDDGRRDRVRGLIDGHASLREVGRNALLLTLACAESELRRMEPETTRRVHLYYWVVRDLMRGAWKDKPQDDSDPAADRELRTLRRFAWGLFRPEPARIIFDNDQLFDVLNGLGYDDLRAEEQLRKWGNCGLLLPGIATDTKRAGTFFLHRTFLEFLAADYVAHLPDPVAEGERYLWQPDGKGGELWTPPAQEFVAFVAGGMAQPAKLLERLLRENDALPDLLGVMLRLAGKCLAEADEKAVPEDLQTRVEDGCLRVWEERGRTVGAARSLGSRQGVNRLIGQLTAGETPAIRESAAEALGALGNTSAVRPLADALRDDDAFVRRNAAKALTHFLDAPLRIPWPPA